MANLDVLFLVASTTQPTPSTLVLDKLSAIAVDKGVQPVVVCTKGDLGEADFCATPTRSAPCRFIRIDTNGRGPGRGQALYQGQLCAFCGNSGVGKSTLLNAPAARAAARDRRHQPEAGPRPPHHPRGDIFEALRRASLRIRRALPAWRRNRAGFIPKENLEHAFPEFGPYLGSASLRAAPTAVRPAVLCVPRWRGRDHPQNPLRQLLCHV